MTHRVVTNLLDFSDDVILHICSNLNGNDLLSLFDTCERLYAIARDHSLWKRADLSHNSLTASQVSRRVLKCLHKNTTSLHFKGHKRAKNTKWKADLITPAILKSIGKACPNLTELSFKEAVVNARKVKLINFEEVKSIKQISFVDCEFINLPSPTTEGSYFKHMTSFLPNLVSLEISYANWITDYDLMVLSKLDSLKKLVVKCDPRIGFTTAYLSISFRFGFKGLEELDMRGTSLTNLEIQSVSQGGHLKSLKLGPIGKVRRLKNDVDEGFGLVIPDPHRRDEPKQQVVVINMSPNGPQWRPASDDDLDMMGLDWLKKGLHKMRSNAEKEDEHFFFGKEGKIVKSNPMDDGRPSSSREEEPTTRKRKLKCGFTSNIPIAKRHCEGESEEDDSYPPDIETPPLPTHESSLPDELLSDLMTQGLRLQGKNLERLEVIGCSITDTGLLELVKYLPRLTSLDVSKTCVTPEGLQQARILAPNCSIICDPSASDDR